MSHQNSSEHTVLSGEYNPSDFNKNAPLVLFIIQLVIIMGTTRLLNVLLSRVQQPRVISEIIGGIILGPSVLGRIPGFKDKLFPKDSLSYLNLVANFGLVLYLFLVGLEVDPKMITRNAKVALSISGAGILLPFATGIAVSYGLYEINEPGEKKVPFSSFLLFMGAAMSITAFPVLARIVTELKLLRSYVGSTVLCAAVGDDVAAWVLLALVISILNSTNSLVAVYIILCVIGWALVLFFFVRPVLLKLIKKTGSNINGPTVTMMSVTLLVVFASAFVTDVIGVHAIFGGFLVGLMIPHEGSFAVSITEKIEDLVNILFLPIYFALSGLKTEIRLLNTGAAFGYIFLVIFVAMSGKLVGCTLAARAWRFEWREAATVGIFMSCKGLVELIVLNIGLDAGVIDKRVFAIMVVMAIVTTCATTPLAIWAYPAWYQREAEARRNRKGDIEHNTKGSEVSSLSTIDQDTTNHVLVVLNKLENVPSIMTLIQLLQPQSSRRTSAEEDYNTSVPQQSPSSPLTVHALRLMDLGQRLAPVIKFAESKETLLHDPITNVVRTFGHLNFFNVKASLAVVPFTKFAEQVADSTHDSNADTVIVPWAGRGSIKGVLNDDVYDEPSIPAPSYHEDTSPQVANYVQGVFAEARARVAVLVDRGLGVLPGLASVKRIHGVGIKVFFPFFGGINDRAALEVVVRLIENPRVTAHILRITKSVEPTNHDVKLSPSNTIATDSPFDGSKENADVKHPQVTRKLSDGSMREQLYSTRDRLASNEADEIQLLQYFNSTSGTLHSHPRVSYNELLSSTPLQTSVDRAVEALTSKDLVVIGRTHRDAPGGHREEWLDVLMGLGGGGFGNETRKSLGELAESMIVSGVKASILVVQGLKEKRD